MARPAYVAVTAADASLDGQIRSAELIKALKDNAAAGRIKVLATDLASASTAVVAPTWTDLLTCWGVGVPGRDVYTGIQRRVIAEVDARVTTGTGKLRLLDRASAATGPEVNVTATSDASHELTVDLSSGNWREIVVQAQAPAAGTIFARADDRQTWRVEY